MNQKNNPHIAAVILAAGRGNRAKSCVGPKQYHPINGKAIIEYSIELFTKADNVKTVVLVINPDDEELYKPIISQYSSKLIMVNGGDSRKESTYLALKELSKISPDYVYIHDAARPFTTSNLLNILQSKVSATQGVIPVLTVSDTVKEIDNNYIKRTLNREILRTAQTPQLFPFELIFDAHLKVKDQPATLFTDDSSIAEYCNIPVAIVDGEMNNLKITYPEDLIMQTNAQQNSSYSISEARENIFPDIRTAMGYDVHQLVDGTAVTLCGVVIPHTHKLKGHSDADVALHALTDALLATLGDGDIGVHFPPSEAKWKGAESKIFLAYAADKVKEKGGKINNIDITLICEAPKISPHVSAMKLFLQDILALELNRISIKATTNETLGFIGRQEGIASFASATVYYPAK